MSNSFTPSVSNPAAIQLEPETYFLLRRPLLPIQTVWQLHADTSQTHQQLLKKLLDIYIDPTMQEAIYTASPALHTELLKALTSGGADSAKEAKKLALTLYKYTLRMSTRCTPYGLFAGCAHGRLGERTVIKFAEQSLRRQSRLDMNYVGELAQHLIAIPALREQLYYYPNNSLYKIGDRYRYIEVQVRDKQRSHTIIALDHTAYLSSLLVAAENGCCFAELSALVCQAEPSASREEARAYVHQLIDSQVLISELEPTITGNTYFDELPARLKGKLPDEQLMPLRHLLQLLHIGGVVNFQKIHQLLEQTYGQSNSKDLIQTDLFFNTEHNQLNTKVTSAIAEQVSSLLRLSTRQSPVDLASFIKNFSERFEDQEIPLLIALDSESGVGYGSMKQGSGDHLPALEGIKPKGEKADMSTNWKKTVQLVHELYHRALRNEAYTVELTDADLSEFDAYCDMVEAIPTSLYAFGTLLAEFALNFCSGPSAANLLGRFCYGDEQLLEDVRDTLQRAEPDNENTLYAEIVHLPEARIGNVLMRPHLRSYEIPFLCPATVPAENQIHVQDLLVSVRQGRVILRSKRLNKQIIPRLSTAHNYSNGLPIYRFLCELQHDNSYVGVSWNWYNLGEQVFLPRVEYKNIIVAKAQWLIERKRLTQSGAVSLESQLFEYLANYQLPRYFCLVEGDNELLIDSEYPTARQLLLQKLEKTGVLRLTEFLATPDRCFIGTDLHKYTNELILPLYNPGGRLTAMVAPKLFDKQPTQQFMPGSEWVYFKLYGGTKSLDQLLPEVILPLVEYWKEKGLIRQWFFIRYSDPHYHLRIRFQLTNNQTDELATIMHEMSASLKPALTHGRVHKIQLDTYIREVERYGADSIALAEELFCHDSITTVRILNLLNNNDADETYRWLLALRGLDELLTDFDFSLAQKQVLLSRLSRSFFQEFNGDKILRVQLNEKYRQESHRIQQFLNPAEDIAAGIEEATQKFTERRHYWRPVILKIQAQHPADWLKTNEGYERIFSYVHMYINRFMLSQPRLHELTLYTLLEKYYTAQLCKAKIKVSSNNSAIIPPDI
jgi:thiopeptide-type bacteriocin biosynthesis protein